MSHEEFQLIMSKKAAAAVIITMGLHLTVCNGHALKINKIRDMEMKLFPHKHGSLIYDPIDIQPTRKSHVIVEHIVADNIAVVMFVHRDCWVASSYFEVEDKSSWVVQL